VNQFFQFELQTPLKFATGSQQLLSCPAQNTRHLTHETGKVALIEEDTSL
jgi:hypothetical protein